MYMYKAQVYEEILVTIEDNFFKANPQLISEDDTLKIVIEVSYFSILIAKIVLTLYIYIFQPEVVKD